MSTDPSAPDAAASPAPRTSLRPLGALVPFARRYTGRIATSALALLTSSAATLVVPIALRRVIDHGFTGQNAALVDSYFLAMLGVAVVLAAASGARYLLVTSLGERIVADIRKAVFAHLVGLSAAFYDTARTGELVSRLTADTTQIKAAFGASASIALRNLLLLAGAVAMMVATSPMLSVLVLVVIPLIALPLIAFGRSVRSHSRTAQGKLAEAAAFAAEMIGATRTVQAFSAEPLAAARFDGATEAAYAAARQSITRRALLTASMILVVSASVVGILWYGATDVIAGRMSPGTLGQFLLYAVFAASSLGQLSEVWGEVSQAAGAAERLGELLNTPNAIADPASPTMLPVPVRGDVRFEAVSFAYPTHPDKPVLRELTFHVRPGETVAIVGPSGAGKSTIFHLLLRFYDPAGGGVRIDGTALTRLRLADLRSAVALVAQDPLVFAATAAHNIGFGRAGATDGDIERAARLASAETFIRAMPQGFETMLGERGATLSGGQRQRIALARAILKDAPILLLDEATSALDAEAEFAVQDALRGLAKGRTTLVIAHRLATVLAADRILVLNEGRVVEEGTHKQLVSRGGLYARLAELQFRTGVAA